MLKTKAEMEIYLKELEHKKTIQENEKLFSLISDLQRRIQSCIDNEKYTYVMRVKEKKIFFFITVTEEKPYVLISVDIMNDGVRLNLSREYRDVIIKQIGTLFTDHIVEDFDFSTIGSSSIIYHFYLSPKQ